MSNVKSFDTKPELIVRKFLFANGFRFRLHDKSLPAKPDIKLTKYSTLIFIHGCFWHGHENCKIYVMPKTNRKFWHEKIDKNIKRDKKIVVMLRKMGWHVYTIWECDLKPKKQIMTLEILKNRILKNDRYSKI